MVLAKGETDIEKNRKTISGKMVAFLIYYYRPPAFISPLKYGWCEDWHAHVYYSSCTVD